jgi:hypothetical protein
LPIYYQGAATINTSDGTDTRALKSTGTIMNITTSPSTFNVNGGGVFAMNGKYIGNTGDILQINDAGTIVDVYTTAAIPGKVQLAGGSTLTLAAGVNVNSLTIGSVSG